jgi:hypothetical protein
MMASTHPGLSRQILRTIAALVLTVGIAAGFQPHVKEALAAPILDPAVRVQIFIDHVFVQSDGDWHSSGELTLSAVFARCPNGECKGPALTDILADSRTFFSADSGTFPELDRIFPKSGDSLGDDVTEPFGLPLENSNHYGIWFHLTESDGFLPGAGYEAPINLSEPPPLIMSPNNNWQIGQHEQAATSGGDPRGRVNYEIRKVSLPDLQPLAINVFQNPGGGSRLVCTKVLNMGTEAPGAFQSALYVDGALGGQQFIASAGTLPVGEIGDLCMTVALPTTGRHILAAVVDGPHGIFEQDETNNRFEYEYYAPIPAAGTSNNAAQGGNGAESSSSAQLSIESIRMNGKEPSGQNDCDRWKNDVTVTMHNGGTSRLNALVVRALVDDKDDDATEKTLNALDPGKSADITLDDVKLTKGTHTISITAREKSAMNNQVSQSNRSVTVDCKGD